mgnify:FL=1
MNNILTNENVIVFVSIAAIMLIVFVVLSWGMQWRRREKNRSRMKFYYGRWRDVYYSDEVLSIIKEYTQSKECLIDEITWNDLNMDDVFQKINHTWSFAGEDYLYYLMHVPVNSKKDWKDQEELIRYYQEHERERIELQMLFGKIGKYHGASIYSYISRSIEMNTHTPLVHYLCPIALAIAIGSLFFNPAEGVGFLILVVITNIGLYFSKRRAIENSMQALQYFLNLQKAAGDILKKKLVVNEHYREMLQKDYTSVKKYLGWTTMLKPADWGNQSLEEIVLDYFRLVTHLDNILFYRCMRRLKQNMNAVENLITTMGFLESIIAIGSLRKALPYYCVPEFSERRQLEIQDAYHPLIEAPIANSICAEKGILITGSNASGKSTFLKTVAINAIMAQGLHTCAANIYRGPWCHIFSSMALRDNIYQGESYFIAEIKALKRILEAKDENLPVLCFVDEVLRGTNTVERIAASTQVLREFQRRNILCFAATHDIELTFLLENEFENYHFQEQIQEGEVLFNYRLYKGRSNSRNAIRLLELLGYETDIVEGANEMVARFLKDGKWSLE